jgi:protocatechuate 3,4-dioxygenase beta subunit
VITLRALAAFGVLISLASWDAVAQPRNSARRFTLSGTLVDGVGGQPMAGAQVSLTAENGKDVADPTVSDSQGRFAFGNLPAGEYALAAEGASFGMVRYGEAPDPGWVSTIRIGGESGDKSVVFRVAARGSIEGVVRDEFGDPMVHASVTAVRPLWRNGKRTMVNVDSKGADDRGRYRFGSLMPGTYVVCITGGQNTPAPVPGPVDFAARVDNRYYARTCSQSLQIAPGQHAQLDLSPIAASTVTIRGHVRGVPAQTGFGVNLTPEQPGSLQSLNAFIDASQSAFTIRGVSAGHYLLHAQIYGNLNNIKQLSADIPVDVGGSDVDGLEVALDSGATVDMITEGDSTSTNATLRNADSSMSLHGASRDKDGVFHFNSLSPGRYWVDLPSPEGACLQSLKQGDKDVTGKPFVVEAGATVHLAATFSKTCGSFRARAIRDGVPVPGAKMVVLVSGTAQEPGTIKEDFANDEGEFLFSGLAPGHYSVWSWAVSGKGAMEGPESLGAVAQQATAVDVTAGEPAHVDVPLLAGGSGQ